MKQHNCPVIEHSGVYLDSDGDWILIGHELELIINFCPHCGMKLEKTEAKPTPIIQRDSKFEPTFKEMYLSKSKGIINATFKEV